MRTLCRVFMALVLAAAVFSCQQDGASSGKGGYVVHPEQSQLVWNMLPIKQGPMTTVTVDMDGRIKVNGNQIKGGRLTLNMEKMRIEHLADPSTIEKVAASIKSKALFHAISVKEGQLVLGKIVEKADAATGSTHLVKAKLTLRKKKKSLEIPARIMVENGNAILMTQPFKVDLTQWGMNPGRDGWQDTADLTLRLRAESKPAAVPKEKK